MLIDKYRVRLGSWTKEEMQKLFTEIVPEMFQLATGNKMKAETETVKLQDIEKFWDTEAAGPGKIVVTI